MGCDTGGAKSSFIRVMLYMPLSLVIAFQSILIGTHTFYRASKLMQDNTWVVIDDRSSLK